MARSGSLQLPQNLPRRWPHAGCGLLDLERRRCARKFEPDAKLPRAKRFTNAMRQLSGPARTKKREIHLQNLRSAEGVNEGIQMRSDLGAADLHRPRSLERKTTRANKAHPTKSPKAFCTVFFVGFLPNPGDCRAGPVLVPAPQGAVPKDAGP